MMKLIAQCLFSPRLYKVYREGAPDTLYQPVGLEKWGDKVISSATTIMNITLYTSPFICMYIYKRGFFSTEETKLLGRLIGSIGCLLAVSFILRAYGRATNPKYVEFLKALKSPLTDKKEYLKGIRKYDFEFKQWPATFTMSSQARTSWIEVNPFGTCVNSHLPLYQRSAIQFLAFLATHTFGLRLIYPGSMTLIQSMLWMPLFQGRTNLVEVFEGQRAKLQTADGNTVDTMFVDRRTTTKGKFLIICCEGNSGFYEFGIMTTPVKAGYSALGWNHPGFAGSSGFPYPSQEHNAIDAVMQYAIQELEFDPDNIVMFGWSIGGYSAAWAAVNYPVKGLILDATFDDLLPLAENQMPSSWSLLVKEVVRSYVDLNIGELLAKYSGPVQLVRRTEDEIICLRPGHLSTNRGNHLLMRIIEQRHPDLILDPLAKMAMFKLIGLLDSQRNSPDSVYVKPIDKHLVEVIMKYMRDYRSTHCTPLPEDMFEDIMESISPTRR